MTAETNSGQLSPLEERRLKITSDVQKAFNEKGLGDQSGAIYATVTILSKYSEARFLRPQRLGIMPGIDTQTSKLIMTTAVELTEALHDAQMSTSIKRPEPKS